MDDQHAISGNNTGIITQQEKKVKTVPWNGSS
jgi:hypothetical protein